ncbi:heme-binding protein [Streptomyces sp. NPDC056503]|uniref:GlcG/HbpS family heme-binding protein n=1 Tax=Streptomyces sp. NPDC056503 TaxID=3345842 RepID=UPI00368AC66C
MKHVKKAHRTRLTIGGALVALALAGVGAYSASAGGEDTAAAPATVTEAKSENTTATTHLTVAAATKAARAALDAAEAEKQRVTVAVVDRNGNTIVTLRGDGAGPQSYASAERKAYTAVAWNAPTSVLAGRLAQAPRLKDIPGTLFLGGGVPVSVEGGPVAGVGVAGAPSGDLDEKFARAGVAALAR